jgi:16S rRNA (guanine966-N2)-methyltransferase
MVRIISGGSRGRRLTSPKGQAIRPTSDRVKESIFNMLGGEVEGKVVLDLFAGTGSLGLEALSRGARRVIFVEKAIHALRILKRNIAQCGMEDRSETLPKDVLRAIGILKTRGESFDLILMDPPYARGLVRLTWMKLSSEGIYHPGSTLVIEHDRREILPSSVAGWTLMRERKIGDTVVSIFTAGPSAPLPAGSPGDLGKSPQTV